MNILMITENDPAGMGIAFTRAINQFSEHRCRLITTTTRYEFDFEKDLHIPDLNSDGIEEVFELLRNADILHFHILADETIRLGPIIVKDFVKGKALLHHHHGHPDFRGNPGKYRDKYRRLGRRAIVSTPDLLHLLSGSTWQPNLVPVHAPLYLPLPSSTNGALRVCQSPTRTDLKNTTEFENVMASLESDYPHLKSLLIENTRHRDCLRIKQTCHIHFDHMQGYFGVASLEGLSQGKPVIAGLDDWNISCIRQFTGEEEPPWVIATNQVELENRIRSLIEDEALRERTGRLSRAFMERAWSEQKVIKRLFEVYETL